MTDSSALVTPVNMSGSQDAHFLVHEFQLLDQCLVAIRKANVGNVCLLSMVTVLFPSVMQQKSELHSTPYLVNIIASRTRKAPVLTKPMTLNFHFETTLYYRVTG